MPTNIPEIDGKSRIPQNSAVSRTAKPSKIAKPSGIVGSKISSLPKSLSNEKICQASNLVQKTTKNLFKSKFGKPPEPKQPPKMNSQPKKPPLEKNATFAISRPPLLRSDTFDKSSTNEGINLTQNVISKLQEQTFTAASNVRTSLSPVPSLHQFTAATRIGDAVGHSNSTPFRSTPITKFSTRHFSDKKSLPPTSFNIAGTDATVNFSNIADTKEPSFLSAANLSPVSDSPLMETGLIVDTNEPSFFAQCTPREKFKRLAEHMAGDTLLMDAMSNFHSSVTDDESTIKNSRVTSMLCTDSVEESTLVSLVPSDGGQVMEVDERVAVGSCGESNASSSTPIDMPNKQRFSFGQDMTEWTLDCSIELYDSSVGSSAANAGSPTHLKKQNSFDDKSLSILTPDQMNEFLDSNNTNLNLDLPLFPKMPMSYQCRIDQTPSPEELPLDPVGVKTDSPDLSNGSDNQMSTGQYAHEQQLSQTDSYSKADQMTKSGASKVSNSFITSVTSITSLDTGYQGDGEMSRPASRGEHSPSNMPRVVREPLPMNRNQNNIAIVRRQDPMTDSDFFTESDADDIVNRGDRRAQVIDGQLYAPMAQCANVNHYVNNQQPSTEDSCMDSSGIFTDVENRADDELQHRHVIDSDMSPDGSTDTIKSSAAGYNSKSNNSTIIQAQTDTFVNHQGHSMSDSTTSTINSSCEKEQKQNKNEAIVALKKHEMSKSKRLSGEKLRNVSSSGVLSNSGDIENQENKRPATGSSRKVVPNKWDAVMNKIASNKTNVKSKNYNEVKSKVTCGLLKKDSPGLLKSPTTEDDLFVTTSKRNILLSSKRGRTQSQQSSQSDISEHVGSSRAKLRPSSTPRAAKKRDVRAISSPNELANTKSNGKCANIKPVTPLSALPTDNQKSSPPPKKFLSKRSTQQSSSSKAPLKDHNRLSGSGTTTTTTIIKATPRNTSPRGTISPKTSQRVILSHTSSHSIQNTTHNGNANDDKHFHKKAHTTANQVDRIVNNGKIDNCLNGVGSSQSVITATKATSTINVVDANLIQANRSVEALAVMVQYLANDLDAFSTPHLKKSNENTANLLLETKVQLEHAQINCSRLEGELSEKDELHKNRENELQDYYRNEFSKLESQFVELDRTSKGRIASLEGEITSKDEQLRNVTRQLNEKIEEKDAQLAQGKRNEEEFVMRIKSLSSTENELREKVLASETEFGERLQLAAMRDRESSEKLKDLAEKLALAKNEVLVLRGTSNVAASPKVVNPQPMILENEIESWRCVLEMKQKEISDLQKQNHELKTAAAGLPGALAKISALEARLEDLTIQLQIKTNGEQELQQKNKKLEQTIGVEVKTRQHADLENEQLKYKIKRNSEKFTALLDIVKNRSDTLFMSDSFVMLNGSDCGNETSPPSTPVVKGVIEKNASVSYVLEMNDDESTEAFVSRVVRRAGSFRQQGNSLSQSASATSILRQHSETHNPGTPRTHNKSMRMRSKSVSTNSSDVNDEKSLQLTKREKFNVPIWTAPFSSTPHSKRSIQIANSCNDNDLQLSEESETESSPKADKGQYFRRSNSYKHTKRGLITCNTAALTSQRPDLCLSLPVHPTVKELKKCQQIKESAGEAMVSGTNSEDEASSASSDGSLSSRSSSSGRRRSSIEDANIEKIVASLDVDGAGNATSMGLVGTPMEVSWSDDVDHFASESAV